MAGYLHEAWAWVEKHPWWVGGGILGAGLIFILLDRSSSGGSGSPAQTFAQAMQWQRLLGKQQVAAINAQNAPSIAATRSGTAQAGIAARSQVAQTRIGAQVANFAQSIGLKTTKATLYNSLIAENQADSEQNYLWANQEPFLQSELADQVQQQNSGNELTAYLAQLADYFNLTQQGWSQFGAGTVTLPGYESNPGVSIYG